MVRLVALVAFLGAVAVLAAWFFRRTDTIGRPRPVPFISLALLLTVSMVAGFLTWRHERLEGRLSAAATALVGSPVEVNCQGFGSSMVDAGADLGFVKWGPDGVPERKTLIKRDVCGDLADYLRSPEANVPFDQVVAVHILSHESMHMAGEKIEAVTECQALQRNTRTAILLGASPTAAQQLAKRYWTDAYPNQRDGYRSRECGPGGTLDEQLPDAPWLEQL